MSKQKKKKKQRNPLASKKGLSANAILTIVVIAAMAAVAVGVILVTRNSDSGGQSAQEKFDAYAEDIGLDVDQLHEDMNSDEVTDRIEQDQKDGEQAGVSSTPTIFVNGIKFDAPQNANWQTIDRELRTMIDDALANNAEEDSSRVEESLLTSDDNHILTNNTESSVTVTEFLDFQCPGCFAYYTNVTAQLEKDYTDSITFRTKNFPLTDIHPLAVKAARTAEAAALQGKYAEMYHALYDNFESWAVDKDGKPSRAMVTAHTPVGRPPQAAYTAAR